MVVLDGLGLDACAVERVTRRQVVGMHVMGDKERLDREQPLEMGDPGLERPQGLPVAQIADVVADPGSASASDRERVLELGAATEDRAPGLARQGDARRRETS